jgi:hypothetical protein
VKLTLIQNYLYYTTLFSELIPLIFCILFYKKLNTKALKVFFIYAILLVLFSGISHFTLKVLKEKEFYFFVIRLFNICEFSIIVYFLHNIIKTNLIKKITLYIIPLFIVYAVIDYLSTDKSQFNNHSHLISALLLIILIIYFFYEKMKTVVMYPLYQSVTFWICVGFFLYFTGTFFFFLFIKSSQDPDFKRQMNFIYGIVTVTKNILLCLSLFANEHLENENETLNIPSEIDLDEFSLTNLKNS